MPMPLKRTFLLACLVPALHLPARADPPPDGERPTRTDSYGDPLPQGAVARMGTVRFTHGLSGNFIAGFSPDGRTLLSRGSDSTIRVWEVPGGRELRRFPLPADQARLSAHTLALARDGRTLAAGSDDGTIYLWDVATGRETRRWQGDRAPVRFVTFSPDGQVLASGHHNDPSIQLRDTATGQELRRFPGEGRPGSVAFSPDGTLLTWPGHAGTVRIGEVRTGKERAALQGHLDRVSSVAFSPDGKRLASGSSGTVLLHDAGTGKELRRLSVSHKTVLSLAFAPDGRALASAGMSSIRGQEQELETIYVWDADAGRELRRFQGHIAQVSSLAFSPDGKTLASAGRGNRIRLWDVDTGRVRSAPEGHTDGVFAVAFAPDGRTLASGGRDNVIRLWDPATGRERSQLQGHEHHVLSLCFSPDGGGLASGSLDGTVRLWDTATGKEIRQLGRRPGAMQFASGVGSVCFSPDGQLLASAGRSYPMDLWEVATGKELRQFPRCRGSDCIAFSPDSKVLGWAAAGISLWDVVTGEELCRLAVGQHDPLQVVFSPDGKSLASGGRDKIIRIWDVATGRERVQFVGHGWGANTIAYSPDGRTLASGGGWHADRGDDTVRLWEVAAGKERCRFAGHQFLVRSVAFSPDGKTVASASDDGTIFLWQAVSQSPGPGAAGLTPGELQARWAEIANDDAALAHRAIGGLVRASGQAVALFEKRLRPVAPPDPAHVRRCLDELDDEQFAIRERATTELERLGELAEPDLRKALAGQPTPEARRRLGQLIERLTGPMIPPERLRMLRAVEVLEHIGTPAARRFLDTLAKGAPQARLTQEAKAALGRLAKRPAAP